MRKCSKSGIYIYIYMRGKQNLHIIKSLPLLIIVHRSDYVDFYKVHFELFLWLSRKLI